jgi:hypothetical protein
MRWHYTVGGALKSIYTDGFIYPEQFVPTGVRPIVWFTSSPVWEETANKQLCDARLTIRTITQLENHADEIRPLTRDETAAVCGGLFRFGVGHDFPLHPFNRILRLSKEQPRTGRLLLETALAMGSNPTRDWWGTFHPVPREHWKALEHFTPEGWQSFTDVEKIMRGELGAAP